MYQGTLYTDSKQHFPSYFSKYTLNFEFLYFLVRKVMLGSSLVCFLVLLNSSLYVATHVKLYDREHYN